MVLPPKGTLLWALYVPVRQLLASRQLRLVRRVPIEMRTNGRDWPADAETMIGLKRLDNLQSCTADVLRNEIQGDLIETGVWRGGATIFMRGMLKAFHDTRRIVWVADSFQGLPKAGKSAYPTDRRERLWAFSQLAVPIEEVQANFARYDLLDRQVRFLKGWFKDTLPEAPIDRLAILRLDGDQYGSTMDALRYLYPKVSAGGYVIIDDYLNVPGCKAAVDEYREQYAITDRLIPVDQSCVFWQRS
jgi:hypothetical protein